MAAHWDPQDQSHIAFRNLKDAKLFALDIGGSLTKIAYYSTVPIKRVIYDSNKKDEDFAASKDGAKYKVSEGARLHFIKFETKQIEKCLDYIRNVLMMSEDFKTQHADDKKVGGGKIYVTGGGAYKFADLIRDKLALEVCKLEEMDCICAGANFLLRNIADESFVYGRDQAPVYRFQSINSANLYPFLLVTIGSGVSVIKVNSETDFERIGGTATGGGTFWGLGRLLTGAKGFDELLELATKGDFRNVDMLVKDIYGDCNDDYTTSLGLAPTLIASSFGKAIQYDKSEESSSAPWSDADMARSLLYLVSNDVGQISTLYAMLHGIKKVYFGGFFLRHHPVGLHTISYAVNYWSKGQVCAHFLRHEGYLGAIGAFMRGAGNACETDRYSWMENLYGSSSFPASPHAQAKNCGEIVADFGEEKVSIQKCGENSGDFAIPADSSLADSSASCLEVTDHLEIDRFDTKLGVCPLLSDPGSYNPDTVDLTTDIDARSYWLQCFEDSLDKFALRAVESQQNDQDAVSRSKKFKEQFLDRLETFKVQPFAHGNLTVRSLLDTREHCLSEFNFHDTYVKQKQLENDQALALLPKRLDTLGKMEFDDLHENLARGILAGNVFDWGAKEVASLMESGRGLEFSDALAFVKPRPWLVDDLDAWKGRLKSGSHRCAAIFIDNSGVDVVLGILPFSVDLLRRGTKVLLCANDRPILNDVTYAELQILLQRAAAISPTIEQSLLNGSLACYNSGQASPCLDLCRLNKALVEAMVENRVDLLVLEGMGRAVHTNLYAKFRCECLKVAVLKNKWLANRLGGEMYSAIFKYEIPQSQS